MNIKVFTDGSFCSNGCGYGVYFPNKEFTNISAKFTNKPTNQRAELYAIYDALKVIVEAKKYKNIEIYTDSKYSIGCLTTWIINWKKNNWMTANKKPVLNLDIIKPIDDIIVNFEGKIKFIHVKAHTNKQDENSVSNNIVDKLAKDGCLNK